MSLPSLCLVLFFYKMKNMSLSALKQFSHSNGSKANVIHHYPANKLTHEWIKLIKSNVQAPSHIKINRVASSHHWCRCTVSSLVPVCRMYHNGTLIFLQGWLLDHKGLNFQIGIFYFSFDNSTMLLLSLTTRHRPSFNIKKLTLWVISIFLSWSHYYFFYLQPKLTQWLFTFGFCYRHVLHSS